MTLILTREAVIDLVIKTPGLTREKMVKQTGCDSDTLKRTLASLRAEGTLTMTGKKRGAAYFPGELGPRVVVLEAPVAPTPMPEDHIAPVVVVPKPELDINTRFRIMSKLTKIVASGKANSLLITGQGGTGKTGEVLQTLNDMGLNAKSLGEVVLPETDYLHVKGKASPAEVYRVLAENPDALIVFDDCDSALEGDGMNILKAALDTWKVRTVSWVSPYVQEKLGLPESFEFRGHVIFISNRKSVDQALQSRGYVVNLTMSTSDMCDRLANMGRKMVPGLTEEQHEELVAFIREHKDEFSDLSLRTYIKIAAMMDDEDWKLEAVFAN